MASAPDPRLLRRLLFALVPLAALWLGWELGTRLLGVSRCEAPRPLAGDWMEMQASTRYLWQLAPDYRVPMGTGTATVNELGIRDGLLPQPKAHRERRLITLGDSGVFGWGVPDGQTWQEQLERLLLERFPGWRFEVVNMGVPGYSTVQSLRLLEDLGWRYEPDLVLVGNVFSDCNIDAFQDAQALALVEPENDPVHRALRVSRLYCALWNGWAGWYASRTGSRNRVLVPGIPRDTHLLERVDRYIELSRVPLGDYERNLQALHTASTAHGANMVLLPLAQEWDVGLWTVSHRPPPGDDEHLAWLPYRDAMHRFAHEHELGLVSMPKALAGEAGADAQRLFVDPVHPSAAGAAVMARALADYFVAHPEQLHLPADAAAQAGGQR